MCHAPVGTPCGHRERVEEARAHLRPCPWASCRHHLLLDVTETGTIIQNQEHLDPSLLVDSCAVDKGELGGMNLDEIGDRFGVTRERVRQIEVGGINKMREARTELEGVVAPGAVLASKTKFTAAPPSRLVTIGKCPTCKTQRRRFNGRWHCAC